MTLVATLEDDTTLNVNDRRVGGEYTEYEPGRYGCPECGVGLPRTGHDHESWCINPHNPDARIADENS